MAKPSCLSQYLLVILFAGILNIAYATQPFWSMDPSPWPSNRADSLTGFDVTKYVINLQINEQTHFVSGVVEAQVTAETALNSIAYRLMGGSLVVNEVQLNNTAVPFTHQDGIITIPLSMPPGAQFVTKIWYSGIPGLSPAPYNIGLKFTANGIYTLSNPDAGRYWWPSYDHPWDKALVDWHITVRDDWLAAANGIRTAITNNGDGTRTHHWVSSSPVATYVIGFAAGPYIEFLQQAGTIPIQNFVLPGQLSNATVDFANVPEMISFFSDLFGPYPFEKYGQVVVNMSTYAAMEHQTMTTFGAAYLTGNQAYESIVAHELAHQWYGNYLTPITMREVWLKEGFATYSEMLWEHHHEGWAAAMDYLRTQIQQYYINWENSNGPHTIFNPEYNLMFAPPTYEKSASVLHMLRLKMGNGAFFEFIRALLTTYPNSNYNTSEFIALAQQHSGLDLTQFFQQWIFSAGIPDASVAVFSNQAGQAKTYGYSMSPTATQFTLEIPVMIPGSAVADSVVISASLAGSVSYFNIAPGDDLDGIQIDPNHWVLCRNMNKIRMQLNTALPYNGAVSLSWSALNVDIPLAGFNIYRRDLAAGAFSLLNQQPVNALVYIDHTVTNGTSYQYYVSAVDLEMYISLASNVLDATPIDFPFDQGFLVVDETRDGNGSNISPTDQMADDFYADVLQNFSYSQWDYAAQGAPSLAQLSHYPLLLWHADDFAEQQLLHNLDLIGSYVLSGGKLLISGWKYPSVFSNAFSEQFLPGITPTYHNSAVLLALESNQYPELIPDPAKLAVAWNNMLPMSYSFPGASDPLYTSLIYQNGAGNGNPAAIRIDNGGSMVLLGFPLYFMQLEGVRGFVNQFLPQFYPPVSIYDEHNPVTELSLSCYPNPFNPQTTIAYYLREGSEVRLEVFNLRGQKVKSLVQTLQVAGNHQTVWDGSDNAGRQVSSGVYQLRLQTEQGTKHFKMLLLK